MLMLSPKNIGPRKGDEFILMLKEREKMIEDRSRTQLEFIALQKKKLESGKRIEGFPSMQTLDAKERLIKMKLAVQKADIHKMKLVAKEEELKRKLKIREQKQYIERVCFSREKKKSRNPLKSNF